MTLLNSVRNGNIPEVDVKLVKYHEVSIENLGKNVNVLMCYSHKMS